MSTDLIVEFDDVGFVLAGFVAEVPPSECGMVSVFLPYFIEEGFVEIDFFPIGSSVPVRAAIESAEVELKVMLASEVEKHLCKVSFKGEEVRDRLGREDAFVLVSGADDDNGVDADFLVEGKFSSPFLLSPILAGDIVSDFIEERAGDFEHRRNFSLWLAIFSDSL